VEEEGEEVEGEEVEEREEKQDDGRLMMDQRRLQEYILGCCQQTNGGLRDKPGKSRDNYHTCYSLSGLSVAQQFGGGGGAKKEGEEEDDDEDDDEKKSVVVGSLSNLLEPTHPVYNVHREKVKRALEYFGALGCVHEELMNSSLDCVEVDDVEL
jgi:protein farnesyltransferase subunit beta